MLLHRPDRFKTERFGVDRLRYPIAAALYRRLGWRTGELVVETKFHQVNSSYSSFAALTVWQKSSHHKTVEGRPSAIRHKGTVGSKPIGDFARQLAFVQSPTASSRTGAENGASTG